MPQLSSILKSKRGDDSKESNILLKSVFLIKKIKLNELSLLM
jgi:hypothetical protein